MFFIISVNVMIRFNYFAYDKDFIIRFALMCAVVFIEAPNKMRLSKYIFGTRDLIWAPFIQVTQP